MEHIQLLTDRIRYFSITGFSIMKFTKVMSFIAAAAVGLATSAPSYARDIVTPAADYGLPGTQILYPNDSFVSPDGRFRLTFQTDGNLVLRQGTAVLWSSKTDFPMWIDAPGGYPGQVLNPRYAEKAAFQADGNLVVYHQNTPTKDHTPWASNTDGHPNARLLVQNDGNVVIYDNGKAIWNTKTCCH
jgi:hypothetical protein